MARNTETIEEIINALMKSIPKEHRPAVKRLNSIYQKLGSENVLNLVKELSEIPSQDVNSYCITHEDNLDGG